MRKISIFLEDCTGCKRCELACIAAHSRSKNPILSFSELPVPKTRIFVESFNGKPVPLICRHCKEAACVDACITGSMQKDPETGIINNVGHEQKCVGCWMCIMACPYGVINKTGRNYKSESKTRFGQSLKCDLCPELEEPACVSACPNEVLEYYEA